MRGWRIGGQVRVEAYASLLKRELRLAHVQQQRHLARRVHLVRDEAESERAPPDMVRLCCELGVRASWARAQLDEQRRLELLVAVGGGHLVDLAPPPVVHHRRLHLGQPKELREAEREEVLLLRQQPQQQPLRAEVLVLRRREQQADFGAAHGVEDTHALARAHEAAAVRAPLLVALGDVALAVGSRAQQQLRPRAQRTAWLTAWLWIPSR